MRLFFWGSLGVTVGILVGIVGCTQINDTDAFSFPAPEDEGLTCANYCDSVLEVCVDENAQYTTTAQCLQICAHMDLGTTDDTNINTLGCRNRFAIEAIEAPGIHCTSAGPGGNGVCGSNCESFCHGQNSVCVGANQQYNTIAGCMNACATLDDSVSYTHTVLSGNTLACRLSHLSLAAGVPNTHCPHLALDSPVCN